MNPLWMWDETVQTEHKLKCYELCFTHVLYRADRRCKAFRDWRPWFPLLPGRLPPAHIVARC